MSVPDRALPLREIALRRAGEGHPFDTPAVRALLAAPLALDAPVTFLVGENGSGKSTLLEGIAATAGLPAVGAEETASDPSLGAARRLGRALKLTWSPGPRTGLFLRAEDVFGFARRMDAARDGLEAERRAVAEDASLSPLARGLGAMPYARELAALRERYGEGADARSHGEAFLLLFRDRLHGGGRGRGRGLYLLDEPEAPLSPTRQLALLALLIDATKQGGQFLVATHSPILMALPGAAILHLDECGFRPAAWEDLEHVTLTRHFLNDPDAFLRHLA